MEYQVKNINSTVRIRVERFDDANSERKVFVRDEADSWTTGAMQPPAWEYLGAIYHTGTAEWFHCLTSKPSRTSIAAAEDLYKTWRWHKTERDVKPLS